MLRLTHLGAEFLGNACAGAARRNQQDTLALGGIDCGCPAEPERDLGAVGVRIVDRHLQAGTFGIRHIAAGRPVHGGLRGLSQCCRCALDNCQRRRKGQRSDDEQQARHVFSPIQGSKL
jgi:hypothetical protein